MSEETYNDTLSAAAAFLSLLSTAGLRWTSTQKIHLCKASPCNLYPTQIKPTRRSPRAPPMLNGDTHLCGGLQCRVAQRTKIPDMLEGPSQFVAGIVAKQRPWVKQWSSPNIQNEGVHIHAPLTVLCAQATPVQ